MGFKLILKILLLLHTTNMIVSQTFFTLVEHQFLMEMFVQKTNQPHSLGVNLQVSKQTKNNIELTLENNSDKPIFVTYSPPDKFKSTAFVFYSIEKKVESNNKFKVYGKGFHFATELKPILAKTKVVFHLFKIPTDSGTYRVCIYYYDDIKICELLNKNLKEGKITFFSKTEEKVIKKAKKKIYSNNFDISTVP